MLRQSGINQRRRVTLAHGGQQHDRIGLQAAGVEREPFRGRAGKPLRIFGQDQQRCVGRDLTKQVKNSHRDPESVRRRFLAQSEGRAGRGGLCRGQVRRAETQGANQLMKARKGQVRLGLHPSRAQHREAALARKPSRHGQKTGLAGSRLAVQHERAAATLDSVKQRSQQLDLGVPAEQRPRVAPSDRHQRTILAAPWVHLRGATAGPASPYQLCCRKLRQELRQMTYAAFAHRSLPFWHSPISREREGSPWARTQCEMSFSYTEGSSTAPAGKASMNRSAGTASESASCRTPRCHCRATWKPPGRSSTPRTDRSCWSATPTAAPSSPKPAPTPPSPPLSPTHPSRRTRTSRSARSSPVSRPTARSRRSCRPGTASCSWTGTSSTHRSPPTRPPTRPRSWPTPRSPGTWPPPPGRSPTPPGGPSPAGTWSPPRTG